MRLKKFKELHMRFSKFPISKREQETAEYTAYSNAFNNSKEFQNWVLKDKFKRKSFKYKSFCCLEMANRVFESYDKREKIKHDDVDVVINKWEDGRYGIPIHDGGTSIIVIKFCPWCGKKLKK